MRSGSQKAGSRPRLCSPNRFAEQTWAGPIDPSNFKAMRGVGIHAMNDQAPQPNLAERAMDTVTDATRTGAEISAALVDAVTRLTEAFERARRPRQPLGALAALTREAPLSALFVAVLLGVAIGRRH
jgi:hypothetical protein